MTSPYKLEKDYWNDLPREERKWMQRYMRACEYGDMDVLHELCIEAPTDGFERLKEEIKYERRFHERNTPSMGHSRYSEQDYGWAELMKVKESAKTDISQDCWGGVFKGAKGE